MGIFLGTVLLLVFVLVELIIIRYHLKEPIPWREVVVNLNSGHILMWIGRGIEIVAYHFVLTYFSFGWVAAWPVWLQWIFAVFAWDFCFYWLHRLHHKFPFLWGVHEVHHQGEHFSLSLGIRNSWYSSITSIPFFIPLAILGMPLEQFIVVGSVHYFIQFYNHNRIINKSGWLEYIMITPSHHRVHHGTNPEYRDKNCGGTFVFWDKLFGTFQAEMEEVPVEFGLHKPVASENPFWVNTLPFLKLYFKKLAKRADRIRPPRWPIADLWVGLGGILMFCLLLAYILWEHTWSGTPKVVLFALVFFGTFANGGLAEGRRWGWISWILTTLVLTPWFFFAFVPDHLLFGIVTVLGAVHGFLVLGQWRKGTMEAH